MNADLQRIRMEMDKLKPSFPEALDAAFDLMREHQLTEGGDKHHGLLKSIWTQYDWSIKSGVSWNLVRLPRLVHIEVHNLYSSAFVRTLYFSQFFKANILKHCHISPYLLYEKNIRQQANDGVSIYEAVSYLQKEGLVKANRGSVHAFCQTVASPRIHFIRGAYFERKKMISRLVNEGKNCLEIAQQLNKIGFKRGTKNGFQIATQGGVWLFCKKLGIETPTPPSVYAPYEKLIRCLAKEGKFGHEIVKELKNKGLKKATREKLGSFCARSNPPIRISRKTSQYLLHEKMIRELVKGGKSNIDIVRHLQKIGFKKARYHALIWFLANTRIRRLYK